MRRWRNYLLVSILMAMMMAGTEKQVGSASSYPERSPRPEVIIANHVIDLIASTSESEDDPLLEMAGLLLSRRSQYEIRKDLYEYLGRAPEPRTEFNNLLLQIEKELNPETQRVLRVRLKQGASMAVLRAPWPLCVLSGC